MVVLLSTLPLCGGAATVAPISDQSAPLRSDSTAGGDTADANAATALPSETDGVAPTDSENATNVRARADAIALARDSGAAQMLTALGAALLLHWMRLSVCDTQPLSAAVAVCCLCAVRCSARLLGARCR